MVCIFDCNQIRKRNETKSTYTHTQAHQRHTLNRCSVNLPFNETKLFIDHLIFRKITNGEILNKYRLVLFVACVPLLHLDLFSRSHKIRLKYSKEFEIDQTASYIIGSKSKCSTTTTTTTTTIVIILLRDTKSI